MTATVDPCIGGKPSRRTFAENRGRKNHQTGVWLCYYRAWCGDACAGMLPKTCPILQIGSGSHRRKGGILCGLYGVGALLAAYVSCVTKNDGSFKANISAVFVIDNTFRIILYKMLGLLTLGTIKTVLLLIPFALLGLFTGIKCCGHMDKKIVRRLTTSLLILSGISLVLKNL